MLVDESCNLLFVFVQIVETTIEFRWVLFLFYYTNFNFCNLYDTMFLTLFNKFLVFEFEFCITLLVFESWCKSRKRLDNRLYYRNIRMLILCLEFDDTPLHLDDTRLSYFAQPLLYTSLILHLLENVEMLLKYYRDETTQLFKCSFANCIV
jgi:hypothetical protein